MKKIIIVTFVLAMVALSGCASGLLSIYKMDVQQGNALKQESVDRLDVGMKPEQVRYLLGHPTVTDIFQPDNEVVRIERPEPTTKLAKR
jgi:outer membrane protein assembly factor BamE